LKSALQFNALWIVSFLLFSLSSAQAAIKDRYLFRIQDTVVGVHDLNQALVDLAALHCRFPDALLETWTNDSYRGKFKKVLDKLASEQGPLAEDQNSIIFLSSVRQLWKLLIYVDGQTVTLSPELQKSVLSVAGCPGITLSKGKMRDSFQRWLRVEVYLRSRYAPGGIVKGQEWRDKRLQSIAQFVESIDKQLSHENFW
jgi:hypothetical protein